MVGLDVVALPAAGHCQRLVDPVAMGVARQEPARAVELHQDIRPVIDVSRDLAPAGAVIHILGDAPAEGVGA